MTRSVSKTTFDDQGRTILTEYFLVGNHVHCRDEIGGEGNFPHYEGVLRFGYLGKLSPCVYESLNKKGATITLNTLLYVLISL
jgi:hypothetical protein